MSDDDIMRLLLQGGESEEQALRWMYRNMLPMVTQHIFKNNGSLDDAKDVFQDSLLAFSNHVKQGKFQRKSSIATFLMAIVRNGWQNRLRRRGYNEGYVAEMKHVLDGAHEPAPDIPDQGWLETERTKAIAYLLSKLGDKCREILRMRFWDHLKMEQIAVALHYKSDQIAKNKHFRCMEELRTLVQDNPQLRNYLKGLL